MEGDAAIVWAVIDLRRDPAWISQRLRVNSINHALLRTAAGHRRCNRPASWPPSLSLGRSVQTLQ